MAGVSQVALALAYVCAGVVYPNGLKAASVTGRQVVIRRGWLLPNDLFSAQSLRDQTDFITVTAMVSRGLSQGGVTGEKTLAEPLGRPWRVQARVPATVSVVSDAGGVRVVFPSGGVASGIVGVALGEDSGVSAACAVMAQDTPESVAAALALQIPGAVSEGAVVRVAGCDLVGRVVGYGQSVRVSRRQVQRYRVSVWTGDALVREVLGSVVDEALAARSWIGVTDGQEAQVRFAGVEDIDTMQTQGLYRRDYLYDLFFDTREVQWSADMMFGVGTVQAADRGVVFGAVEPVFPDAVLQHALQALGEVRALGEVSDYPGLAVDPFGTVVAG